MEKQVELIFKCFSCKHVSKSCIIDDINKFIFDPQCEKCGNACSIVTPKDEIEYEKCNLLLL